MTGLIAIGALGIGVSIDSIVKLATLGLTSPMLTRLGASLTILAVVVALTLLILRRMGTKMTRPGEKATHKVWSRLGLD